MRWSNPGKREASWKRAGERSWWSRDYQVYWFDPAGFAFVIMNLPTKSPPQLLGWAGLKPFPFCLKISYLIVIHLHPRLHLLNPERSGWRFYNRQWINCVIHYCVPCFSGWPSCSVGSAWCCDRWSMVHIIFLYSVETVCVEKYCLISYGLQHKRHCPTFANLQKLSS